MLFLLLSGWFLHQDFLVLPLNKPIAFIAELLQSIGHDFAQARGLEPGLP